MRKFLYNVMLFAAVCLVGCQSEQLVEGNETDKNTRTIEIFAEMEGEAGSRTALDGSKGQLKWQAGDQLSVFLSGKKSSSAFTINEGFSSTGATFTGEVQDGGNTLKANVAFYPYNEGVTYNDSKSSLTTSISSTQKSNGNGTFAQGVYPMMAVTDGPDSYNFAFKNVLAGTQLYVKGSGQKIVKVVMEVNDRPLAGDYTVGYSKEGVTVTPGENTKNSIELDCRDEYGNGMTLNNGDEYVFTFVHFPMPEANRFVTFTLYEENTKGTGTLKQLKREANIGFSSNTFKHIKVSKFDDVPNTVWVAEKQNLVDAVKTKYESETTVVLAEDVELNSILEITGSNVVLDGNGKTLNSTAARAINVSGANGVTITNLTIEASGERAINIIQNATNVTIDNVTATCANYAVNVASSAKNAVVNIVNSNLTGLNVVNVGGSNATITIENTVLNCKDNNPKEKYTILTLNKDAENSKIFATGVDFNLDGSNNDSKIAGNSTSNGLIKINGSSNQVSEFDAYINYGDYHYTFETIKEAIEYAKAGETVNFIRDVEIVETISIEKNVTINLNGYDLDASSNTSRPFEMADDSKLTIEGKNSNINVGKYGLVNIPSGNDAEVILNGGTYEGNTDNGSFLKPRGKGKISLSLNGVTYEDQSEDGFVMDAKAYNGDDLSLTVNGCTLKAAGGLICLVGKASITNTTLETTQKGYTYAAIEMSGSGSGTIQDSSIKSEGIAVSAGYGASITVTNCNVEGKEYAYCVYQSGGSINVTSGEKGKYTGKVGIYNNLPLYDPSVNTDATGKAKIVIDNKTVVSASFK